MSLFGPFKHWRYGVIRMLSVSTPCLPTTFPFFGGRTILEMVCVVVLYAVSLAFSVNAGSAGATASFLAMLLIFCGNRILNPFSIVLGKVQFYLTRFYYWFLHVLEGISFERSLFWHKLFVVIAIITAAVHGWLLVHGSESEGEGENMSGFILLGLMILMSCMYIIKTYFFEYFYYFHILACVACTFLALIHGAAAMGMGGIVWGCDLLIRYVISLNMFTVFPFHDAFRLRVICCLAQAVVEALPAGVIRITFPRPKSFYHEAGQYCFIRIAEVAFAEYHVYSPFYFLLLDVISIKLTCRFSHLQYRAHRMKTMSSFTFAHSATGLRGCMTWRAAALVLTKQYLPRASMFMLRVRLVCPRWTSTITRWGVWWKRICMLNA